MSPEHMRLVHDTWQRIGMIGDGVAELFYERLFEIDPTTRLLFAKADMAAQRGKLLQALGVVVAGLERREALTPFLQDLGRRHVSYGVRRRHFASVGEALLWAFERGLGDEWTPEVESAWDQAYALVSGIMTEAAEGAAG